jgi:hypothetical protein
MAQIAERADRADYGSTFLSALLLALSGLSVLMTSRMRASSALVSSRSLACLPFSQIAAALTAHHARPLGGLSQWRVMSNTGKFCSHWARRSALTALVETDAPGQNWNSDGKTTKAG